MIRFGNIPTESKTPPISTIEALSQRIIEDTNKNLAKANARLLTAIHTKTNERRSTSMTITRERPTVEDLARLLLQQEEEKDHDAAYYLALADQFLAAEEVEDVEYNTE